MNFLIDFITTIFNTLLDVLPDADPVVTSSIYSAFYDIKLKIVAWNWIIPIDTILFWFNIFIAMFLAMILFQTA